LVPSHIDLSGAEIEMVSVIGRELRLRRALGELPAAYDYILIDCQPSLSLLSVNACAAATEVFVPMQAHPFGLEGLGKLFEVLDLVRAEINPGLELTGVIVTMFDPRTNLSREVMDKLTAHPRLTGRVFKTVVRQNIRIAESQGAGEPVIHFDRSCHGAAAYRQLAVEVEYRKAGAGEPPVAGGGPESLPAAAAPVAAQPGPGIPPAAPAPPAPEPSPAPPPEVPPAQPAGG
jgi:chromosome partitioning protein